MNIIQTITINPDDAVQFHRIDGIGFTQIIDIVRPNGDTIRIDCTHAPLQFGEDFLAQQSR
jgi:hypothetical protein